MLLFGPFTSEKSGRELNPGFINLKFGMVLILFESQFGFRVNATSEMQGSRALGLNVF